MLAAVTFSTLVLGVAVYGLVRFVGQMKNEARIQAAYEAAKTADSNGLEDSSKYWRHPHIAQEEHSFEEPIIVPTAESFPPMLRIEPGTWPSKEMRYFERRKKIRSSTKSFHYTSFGAPRRKAFA